MQIYESPSEKEYHPGDTMSIVCESDLGKPPGKIKWTRLTDDDHDPSMKLNVISEPPVTKTPCMFHGKSILTYIILHGDEGLKFQCEVNHAAMTSPLVKTLEIHVVGNYLKMNFLRGKVFTLTFRFYPRLRIMFKGSVIVTGCLYHRLFVRVHI